MRNKKGSSVSLPETKIDYDTRWKEILKYYEENFQVKVNCEDRVEADIWQLTTTMDGHHWNGLQFYSKRQIEETVKALQEVVNNL